MKLKLLLCFLLFSFSLIAQPSEKFQLETFVNDLNKVFIEDKFASKEEREKYSLLCKKYQVDWEIYPQEIKNLLCQISNNIIRFRNKSKETLFVFLTTNHLYYQNKIPDYSQWLSASVNLSFGVKNMVFEQFIKSSSQLISEQKLSNNLSGEWKVSNLNFEFVNEKDSSPFYLFKDVNLVCKGSKDSIEVFNTSIRYYPLEAKCEGQGGVVYWLRAKFNKEHIFANLASYKVDLTLTKLDADSVAFFNSAYLSSPILGNLEDRLSVMNNLENSLYPQFRAYDSELYVKDIFENMDMRGLFIQKGARLVFGDKGKPAQIIFYKDNEIQGRIQSESFIVRSDKITSNFATWSIVLDRDSLFHRNSEIRYDNEKKIVAIYHASLFNVKLPFQNTYHKVNIESEAMFWYVDKGYIEFGLLKIPDRKGVSYFISEDYFTEKKMQDLIGRSDRNPLFLLAQAVKKFGTTQLYFSDLATYFGWDLVTLKNLLLNLAVDGFVIYDVNTESVTIQNKLFTYQKISAKKSDFDIVKIKSETSGLVNAVLDLDSLSLTIKGVDELQLSEKQNVYFHPDRQEIVLKKNRDISFDGRIHAGSFDFVSKRAEFSYSENKIDIGCIDTLLFAVKENKDAEFASVQIKTQVESFSGILYIDDTSNKGGLKDFPDYPIFESTTPSFVYYNQPFVQQGAYVKDSFYFKVSPFVVKQLNAFNTDSIRLSGTLFSGGIFPPLDEDLIVMEDHSLGFIDVSPKEGWEIYRQKGRFYDTLKLDLKGLQGKGHLNYISSHSISSSFLFKPNVMSSSSTSFDQLSSDSSNFPLVRANSVSQTWHPTNDIMILKTNEDPILVYKEKIKLTGNLKVFPHKYSCEGVLVFPDGGQFKGKMMELNPRNIYGDLVDFTLKTKDESTVLVQSAGYTVNINLDEKFARLESQTSNSLLNFPLHKYSIFVKRLNWKMQENIVQINEIDQIDSSFYYLTSKQRRALNSGDVEFLSTHARQDSLRFFAQTAIFNANDTSLTVDQVPYILVADAAIFPDAGRIVLSPNSKIQKLEKAIIYIKSQSPNFELFDGSVDIFSRKEYRASAKYTYPNGSQTILFPSIKINDNGVSVGEVKISSADKFKLNDAFDFQGKIKLIGDETYLFMEGSSSSLFSCNQNEFDVVSRKNRIKFSSLINPDSVILVINDSSTTNEMKPISRGFYVNTKGAPVYSFMEMKRQGNLPMLEVSGNLSFNSNEGAYQVKMDNDMVLLNNNVQNCVSSASDFIDLYWTIEPLAVQLFSTIIYDQKIKTFSLQSVFALDFMFDEALLKSMADAINADPSLGVALEGNDRFASFLEASLSEKTASKHIEEVDLYGTLLKVPDGLRHTFLFSNVHFKWNESNRSYFSEGNVEIAAIEKNPVFKSLNSKILLTKGRLGDIFEMYLEINPRSWYYFNYTGGIMQIISSDMEFNEKLMSIKSSKRKQGDYEYTLCSQRKKNEFLNRVQMDSEQDSEQYWENQEENQEIIEEVDVLEEEIIEE